MMSFTPSLLVEVEEEVPITYNRQWGLLRRGGERNLRPRADPCPTAHAYGLNPTVPRPTPNRGGPPGWRQPGAGPV